MRARIKQFNAVAKSQFAELLRRTAALMNKLAGKIGGPPLGGDELFYPAAPYVQVPNSSFLLESVFGRTSEGLFVEVGAYDGITFSNSWGLASRGWSGILVELERVSRAPVH